MAQIQEPTLYPIVKTFLESLGFSVKAEVLNIDIVARKDDLTVVVELKQSLSVGLIYQGIKRTHVSDTVYLAIPRPSKRVLKSNNFKHKKTIVRRLELGLLLVDLDDQSVEVLLDPKTYHFKKNKKKKRRLLKEFTSRQTTLNTGGTSKVKIITAYRELALIALDALKDGPKSTKYLRDLTHKKKVVSILQKNYYGWFKRVERGVYTITSEGEAALKTYQHVINDINNT
jgi:hypothetical protein